MEMMLKVVRWLRRVGDAELEPTPDPAAALGHRYTGLGDPELDGERMPALLDGLFGLGCLSRRPVDRIHTCPKCGRWEINFREVCPSCHSVDHQLQEMLHHFPCAYAGPRAQFTRNGGLECPKCERELLQIGIDYDRPGQVRVCACGEVFDEPLVECRCLSCRALFPVTEAKQAVLYAYRLTARGRVAADTGELNATDFGQLAEDPALKVFTFGYMSHRLSEEALRAKRFARPLSVVLIQAPAADDRGETPPALVELAGAVRTHVRPGELLGRFDRNTLLYILPETTPQEARRAVVSIQSKLRGLLAPSAVERLQFGLSGFPEHADRDALLLAARESLVEKRQPGELACAS